MRVPIFVKTLFFVKTLSVSLLVVSLSITVLSTTATANPIKVLAFGDSLTAGFGLPQEDGFVPVLEQALAAEGLAVEIVNGGVSGDTSAGGLARLGWSLADNPDLAILELGANDGLRGIDPASTKENLAQIIDQFQQNGVAVFLTGMLAPPNLGSEYAAEFNPIYPELADRFNVPLYPFFLEGVAADPNLNQSDGIHPNAKGVEVIVDRITPPLAKALQALK